MTVKADNYQVTLRFPRLFPDPEIFEDQRDVARRYLEKNGLSPEKTDLIFQTTDDLVAVDDRGTPSLASGTSKFSFDGRSILAEYMTNANIRLGYLDFGTGMSPGDHSNAWGRGKLGALRFELRDFKHRLENLDIPEISELYRILKERATPTTLSTIELDRVPDHTFKAARSYVEAALRKSAKLDGLEVEVYSARELSQSEKTALERRLTRQAGKSTIFVILSRESGMKAAPTRR